MPSNIRVSVTADVVDLQAKFAVARAESQGLTKELNTLAREAVSAGGKMGDDMKAKLLQAAEASTKAKAEVRELSTEMRGAEGATSRFGAAMTQAQSVLGQFGLALSIAGILQFLRSTLQTAAALQDQAESLDISVDSLQAYLFVARQVGADMDTAGTALQRFTANLGELQKTGGGPLKDDLQQLGLTADQLRGDPLEALIVFARGLDTVKDAEVRASIERDAFGRSGVTLNDLMHKLAEGTGDVSDKLKEMEQHTRDAGQAFDPQATKAAKEFDAAIQGWVTRAKSGITTLIELVAQVHGLSEAQQENYELQERLAYRRRQPAAPASVAPPSVPEPTFVKPHAPSAELSPLLQQILSGDFADRAGAKAANTARLTAEAIAQIWEQAALRHVQSEEQTNAHLLQIGQKTLEEYVAQSETLEEKRFQIELDGIHKREAADKGDAAALKKDKAEEATLLAQYEDRLTRIREQGIEKRIAAEKRETQNFISDKQDELQTEVKGIEDAYDLNLVTDRQRHDLEKQLTAAVQQEVLRRKDAEIAGLKEGTDAWKDAVRERAALERKFTAEVRSIDTQLVKAQEQQFEQGFHVVTGSFNNAVTSMLFHATSFEQAMSQLALSLGEGFVNMGLEIAEKWIMSQLEMLIFGKAADAERITAAAAVTFAETMAAFSGIPIPGFAEAMAAQRMALVLGQLSLLSAERGLERVDADGQLAMLHKDESVLPARISRPLMGIVENMSRSGPVAAAGGGSVAMHTNFTVHTPDSAAMGRWLRNVSTRREIERTFRQAARRANRLAA